MVATISVGQKVDNSAYVVENVINRKQEDAPSRQSLWVLVRLVTCLLCLVPAGMQVVALYEKHYAPYRSRVELNIEYPENVSFPAVTVCNKFNVKFSEFCKKNEHLCKSQFHDGNKNVVVELNRSDVRAFVKRASVADMASVAQKPEDFIKNCMVLSDHFECGTVRRIFFHPMINCFTFFSHWDTQDYSIYENYKTVVWIRLDFQTVEFADFSEARTLGKVIVHDPNIIPNPLTSGHEITGGHVHSISVKKMTHLRLPPPYETNCKRYNLTNMRSQSLCYSKCLETVLQYQFGCLLSDAPQPEVTKLSPCNGVKKILERQRKEIEKTCDSQCGMACREDIYDVNIESHRVPIFSEDEDNRLVEFKADLWIKFETNAHEIYSHKSRSEERKSWTHDSVLILWGMLLLLFFVGAVISTGQICYSVGQLKSGIKK